MLAEEDLAKYFSEALSCPLIFSVCTEDIPLSELSSDEHARLKDFKHEKRKSSWLRGRNALKRLLRCFSDDPVELETAFFPVPNPRLSLSHTEKIAVSVARKDDGSGVGIDIEGAREVRLAMKKFFLSEIEQNSVSLATNDSLLRLWTIKEALFKADMKNKDKTLLKYELDDAADSVGYATTDFQDERLRFKYASKKFGENWLSVAIAIKE